MKWNLLGKITLLIVDDDEFNRQLVISLLSKISTIHFIQAEDGKEALEILKETPVDMVLLDLHMPKLDGYETLEAIKKEKKYDFMPVAIITTDEQEMNKLYSLGADDFISKPFKLTELESRIYAHIEKRQYRQKYHQLSEEKIEKTVIESEEITTEDEIPEEEIQEEEIAEKTKLKEKPIVNYTQADIEAIENVQKEIFFSMAKMLAMKNNNLEEIQVVALLSKALALLVGYDKEKADLIYYATFIREIGTLSLTANVPASYHFSDNEIQTCQEMMLSGHKLLKTDMETDFIKISKRIIFQSKEHYNGLGFPKQYSEKEIHTIAYIVSLVDTFNALLSKENYLDQKIYTKEETYALLEKESGLRFHPKITELFLTHFDYFIGLREKIIKQNL